MIWPGSPPGRAKHDAGREASRDPAAGVKAWHAWIPEQLPRPAGQAVVEDALEATVSRLRKRLAKVAGGVRIETKRGIGYRLVVGEDP